MKKEIYHYIIALSNLYGMVHKDKVVEIFNLQNADKISTEDVEKIQKNLPEEIEDEWTTVYKDYFVKTTILDHREFQHYLIIKGNKAYYIPEKEELLRYADDFYFEKNKAYHDLLNHLKRYFKGNPLEAENVADEIQSMCQFGFKMQHILDMLEAMNVVFKTRKDSEKMINMIVELSNNTRIWENNGYTPNEIGKLNESNKGNAVPILSVAYLGTSDKVEAREKAGRNDPCPCGSGKKYKNCCLRKS